MQESRMRKGAALTVVVLLAACGSGVPPDSDAAEGSLDSMAAPSEAPFPNPFPTMLRPWGTHPDGLEWGQVSAVALDLDGSHIWIADRCGASSCVGSDRQVVMKVDSEGQVLTSFGRGLFIRPHGVHVDAEGNVWVTDHRNPSAADLERAPESAGIGQQVFKFSPEGEVLLALGTAGEPGDPPERLNNPTDVIVAPDGSIFVSEGHSNANPPGRISKFSADGTFLMSWGEFGEGEGNFRTPHGLAFDSQGRLFVADRGNNRVQLFDQEGNFLEAWPQFGRPNDVFIDTDDTMYVIDSESSDEANPGFLRGIYVGNARTGAVTGLIPAHPTDNPFGTHGEGITVDREGNLYVAEVSIRGMTKYLPR